MKPSRTELLADGGIYPFVLPLDWVFIGAKGERVAIPGGTQDSFHRILAKGALLATEADERPEPEVALVRQVAYAPLSAKTFARYADDTVAALRSQKHEPQITESTMLQSSALSPQSIGKLSLKRCGAIDRRIEIHYLVADKVNVTWEIVYLLRSDATPRWSALLAAIETPT